MYKKIKLISIITTLLITVFVGQSYANISISPVNPAYKEYVKQQQVEKIALIQETEAYHHTKNLKNIILMVIYLRCLTHHTLR